MALVIRPYKNVVIACSNDDHCNCNGMSMNLLPTLSSRKYDKILVLVGNNHTIKNIKWHEDFGDKKKKYLAGYMISGDVEPCSIQQLFRGPSPIGDAVLVKTDTEIGSLLAMEAIHWVNHNKDMTDDDVCDGVVEWR